MAATSLSQVCGFIATIRSTPPRAPRWPASVTRTSYQVGRPWMLDGNMFLGATGTPIRSPGRATLGAQPAMQADVLVLDHDAAGLQVVGDIQILGQISGGRLQPRAKIGFLAVVGEGDAVHRADVDAGIALDAQRARKHRLH